MEFRFKIGGLINQQGREHLQIERAANLEIQKPLVCVPGLANLDWSAGLAALDEVDEPRFIGHQLGTTAIALAFSSEFLSHFNTNLVEAAGVEPAVTLAEISNFDGEFPVQSRLATSVPALSRASGHQMGTTIQQANGLRGDVR